MFHSWQELVLLTDDELGRVDVAEVNLACAASLPGTNRFDASNVCKKLDSWAENVRHATEHFFPTFAGRRSEFGNSEGQFRVAAMLEVLQRVLRIQYDSDLIHRSDFFKDGSTPDR